MTTDKKTELSGSLWRRNAQMSALYAISRALTATIEADHAILEVFNLLRDRLQMTHVMLGTRDVETGKIEIVASTGFPSRMKHDPHYRWAAAMIDKVTRSGYPHVSADVEKEVGAEEALALEKQAWAVFVPMKVRGRNIGALMVEASHQSQMIPFEDEINFLRVLSSLVGQSIELQERVGAVQKSSTASRSEGAMPSKIVGESHSIRDVLQTIDRVGPGSATVLIRGESGTGKELVAQALHEASPRHKGPFVKVVCAALPETLLETALFGHERGAFTGAMERRIGFLEEASGGTVFLDEIGDIPQSTQIKLLRFLQEKTFERVGGTRPISVDVRVITATNRDLEAAIRSGRFRDDLYYRLNVVPLILPPLRDRPEDIPLLVEHFVKGFRKVYRKEIVFAGDAMRKLQDHTWPGNVRELENFIERLIVLAPDGFIAAKDIILPKVQAPALPAHDPVDMVAGVSAPSRMTLQEMERDEVINALQEAEGIQTRAARLLGITPRQLAYRIKKYGISRSSVSYK